MSTRGISVPEVLVALLIGFVVIHLSLDTMARLRSAQARLAARADGLVALRVTRHVLRSELRRGRPGEDWQVGGDTLGLRAFRGTALVCPRDSVSDALQVSYEGVRWPDPSKDSLLLLTAHGGTVLRDLVATGAPSASCALETPGSPSTWLLDSAAPADVVLARLFERGSYHLSGSALRYRRGLSGRQPLTPEVWSSASRWSTSADRLGIDLVPRESEAGRPWAGFLSWIESP